MARNSAPWFRKSRNCWFVMLSGKQINLGPDKKKAFDEFYRLMLDGKETRVHKTPEAFTSLADRFLDWVQRKRSPDTYEWYRYRLERFARKFVTTWETGCRPQESLRVEANHAWGKDFHQLVS